MGGSSKQTVGYRYFLGMHMALAHGPLDAVSEIQVDRRVAWEGSTDGGTIEIDAPALFGGDSREGGISGLVDVEMGYPSQEKNDYLTAQLGEDIPAFRGVACLVLNQCYMGNNPYLKPWAVKASRVSVTSGGDEQWYIEKATIAREGEGGCDSVTGFANLLSNSQITNAVQVNAVLPYGMNLSASFPTGVFFYKETENPPYAEAYRDARAWIFHKGATGSSGNVFEEPAPYSVRQSISCTVVIGAPDAGSMDDVRVLSFVPRQNATSGAQGASFPMTGKAWVDVDVPGERARFRYDLYDQNIGGSVSVYGSYFPFDASIGSNPDRKWKLINCAIDVGQVGTESYLVGGVFLRYRAFYTNNMSICMQHYVNGSLRQDSWSFSQVCVGTAGWTSPVNLGAVTMDEGVGGISSEGLYDLAHYGTGSFAVLVDSNSSIEISCSDFFIYECVNEDCSDMNPAHIIRECLTDNVWGMGYTNADIDENSFESSADTLHAENMGMSILWDREAPIEDFIGEVLRHIDAVLYVSRVSGKFVLKLIRNDEDSNTITLDESNVSGVSKARRPTISELTNAVSVVYWDASTDEEASVTLHNEALRQIQGVGISTTIQYPGFTNKTIATRAAERDLKALSTPLLSCDVVASRESAQLNIGDVFYLDWPDLNINQTLMRVNQIDYGDGRDNSVSISCVQDVFDTPSDAIQGETTEEWIDPTTILPEASVARLVIEAPYFVLTQEIGEAQTNDILADDNEAGFMLVSGGRQGTEFNANVLVDSGAGFEKLAEMDFHPYAYITEEVSQTDTELSISGGMDLDLVSVGTIAQIGDELVRVDSVNQDSNLNYVSVTVGRGILDTTPKKHLLEDSNGTYIKFWQDFAASDDVQYASGETLDVQIQTTRGNALLDSPPTDNITMASRAIRPYPPGNFQIDGLSYPENYVWTADHSLSWAHRDRLQQTDGNLYDHTTGDIGPEAGVTYRVEGYAFVGDSTVEEQFLQTNVADQTEWGMDSNLFEVDSNMGFPPDDTRTVILKVWAVRDGYDSWQAAEIELQVPPFTDSVGDSND